MFYSRGWGWICMVVVLALAGTVVEAQEVAPPRVTPNALLAIDQNRTTVVERIVGEWGGRLARSNAGITAAQLREILSGLRSDHLLAASAAGTLDGLRDVIANALTATTPVKPSLIRPMALGDPSDDLVYTPVAPCRLFDTRVAQGGQGSMMPNVRRTYGATAPVANQGGPGSCNAATGAAVALIQIGTLTPSGNGLLQGGPQGVASFPNALILYQPGDQYGTAVAMPLNVANGQFDLQVQFAATDLYGDLLGYFKAPSGSIQPSNILWVAPSGGNYTTVQAAINAASAAASAAHPYLVRIAPGIYTEQVTLKDFVDVEGSGSNVTTIQYSAASPTVTSGALSDMRFLTVINTFNGASPGASAVAQSGNSVNGPTSLTGVSLFADGPGENRAVYVTGGFLVLTLADVEAAPSATQTVLEAGLWASGATADVVVRNSKLAASSGSPRLSASRDSGASIRIDNTQLKGTTSGTPACFQTYIGSTFTAAACP